MDSRRSGPSPLFIIAVGALFVFGGYYVWIGLIQFLDSQGSLTHGATQEAIASATAAAASPTGRPTIFVPATFTPLPPCQMFMVNVERAIYRECPMQDNIRCPRVAMVTYGTELCVYGRVPNAPDWYIVELNPNGAFRDIVYIHESVVEAVDPTPTITPTITPPPTVTPLPTATPGLPTDTPAPTREPSPTPSNIIL